jgi:putative transposase
MSNDNVFKLIQPGAFDDQLTEILRQGARTLLAQAVEAEVADFLDKHADLKTEDGRQRVVRHGHLPEREVLTGIGPVAVRQPRVRDRAAAASDPSRIRFTPAILPPYLWRSKSIETLLPILYLKGISTGDFSEALAALLGKDAPGLSPTAIIRLKEGWLDEYEAWRKRDLSAKRYVYVWADGIYLQARLEDEKQCILVLIGATPEGGKELVGFTDGARESAQDWRDPIQGMPVEPHCARHGLQACRSRAENLATPRRQQPVAKIDSRCEIRRWARGHRQAGQPSARNRRRLIDQAVTKNRR